MIVPTRVWSSTREDKAVLHPARPAPSTSRMVSSAGPLLIDTPSGMGTDASWYPVYSRFGFSIAGGASSLDGSAYRHCMQSDWYVAVFMKVGHIK